MRFSPRSSRLSMVSGNGVSPGPRPSYRTYRKMSDIGVQYDPPYESSEPLESADATVVNSTVAEINTSAEIVDLDSTTNANNQPPPYQRPLSVESSGSSSSEERERRKPAKKEEVDVDAICVQQSTVDEVDNAEKKVPEKTEFEIEEKVESNCGLDCLYFSMQCCECTIL